MNHDEATRYLDDLGEQVPDRRPPMADLIGAGKLAERRKTRRTMALVAASVALVLGGGALVQQVTSGDGGRRNDPPTDGVPQAPEGKRLVGMGQVVIAVPTTWGIDVSCVGNADGAKPAFRVQSIEPIGSDSCLALGAAFYALDTPEGAKVAKSATFPDVINGLEVLRTPERPCPLSSTMYCPESVSVPSQNIVLEFRSWTTDFSPILDSLRLLPAGFTTVPYLEPGTLRSKAEAAIEGAGLDPLMEAPDMDMPVRSIDPSSGSVISVGDTVQLFEDVVEEAPTPVVPDGMRLVGKGQAVVAVPEGWRTESADCPAPLDGAIYFVPRERECLVDSTSVLVLDLDSDAGREVAESASTDVVINGLDGVRGEPECPPTANCFFPYSEVLVLPDQGVVFATRGDEASAVLNSVQLLPEQYTTVPSITPGMGLAEATRLARGAGFDVEVRGPTSALLPIQVTLVFPEAGTAYGVGETVALYVELVGMTG